MGYIYRIVIEYADKTEVFSNSVLPESVFVKLPSSAEENRAHGDVLVIFLSLLHVMETWKVGSNQIEMMAINKEDDPIIPAGVKTLQF
jgi:hypothetical protein|tara:strand:+ start:476 stop:739 length:264 start_codon:yes stop_codon:yes gene_type:complete